MIRHLLIPALICFVLQPCPAQQEAPAAAPGSAPHASADIAQTSLAEVLTIYQELRKLQILNQEGRLTATHINQAAEIIKGKVTTLRLLAPEYRKNIIMLADAILWQGQWMLQVYAGDCGIDYEAPLLDEGFETLDLLSMKADQILADKTADPALRQAVLALVNELGGKAVLKQPAQLLQNRWAKDYKTALHFFTGICTAAAMKNDQDCAAALQQQAKTLQYFITQGGAWEIMRLNALAEQFHLALGEISTDSHPFGNPVLPATRCSADRMQALAPFFDTLPHLKTLLLKPQENAPS